MLNDPYAELDDLRDRLTSGGAAPDTVHNTLMTRIILAVSRAIDKVCDRVFYSVTETRYYTAEHGDYLTIDDLVSVTTLKTDGDGDRVYETTWATTDYDLNPENAALRDEPYTSIRLTPNGTQSFSTIRRGVQIVGVWGWPDIPTAIIEACLLQSARLYRRKDAPFGVVGGGELGEATVIPGGRVTKFDPDVEPLLLPYRRFSLVAV